MAKTTRKLTQIKNLYVSIDTTHIKTNKKANQYHFLLLLIYTITG